MANTRSRATSNETETVSLSEETIVECALGLAQDLGLRGLTVRRIGQELGADPTAFYRYFRDKDELLLACMDRVIDRAFDRFLSQSKGLSAPRDWREMMRISAHAVWTTSREYPAITAACFSRVTGRAAELRWVEFYINILSGLGLRPDDVILCYRTLVDAVLSFSALRVTVETLPEPAAKKNVSAWSAVYGAVDPAKYPMISSHSKELQSVKPEAIFEVVIDSILDRIETISRPVANLSAEPR
ncbi:TetR/AcrR family transcriptional regulator [Rhizobium sp. KVB221]|uniref:TetR/AcrR family transcriptional regulator n=1 Tax=Rhizobium setariae TaxID=2801340 RepID=A0A937CPW6_9HYPH|nr:TetR/AcrR family transcriptional regulator [Rhizobium setariae]MBL0372292.1 TetR/AcrR family transcriptional regulator [Rhizobium setariae]